MPSDYVSTEQLRRTKRTIQKASEDVKTTARSAKRPTTPEQSAASTKTLYPSEPQTQPTATSSASTSPTPPKKVTGAWYTRTAKLNRINKARRVKGIDLTTGR